jgi:hypothetical protein
MNSRKDWFFNHACKCLEASAGDHQLAVELMVREALDGKIPKTELRKIFEDEFSACIYAVSAEGSR